MPMIYVDGQEIEVVQGENILEACLNAGLDLPYFCWHPAHGLYWFLPSMCSDSVSE